MPQYTRVFDPGGTFFFTLVTERRRPIPTTELGRLSLGSALRKTLTERPVKVQAIVLLPDHMHTIWTLPPDDTDYPTRWNLFKRRFVRDWIAGSGKEQPTSTSRKRSRRRGVWQRRYWEHMVREDEFEDLVAYIHLNPVKHGYVRCPHEWPYSSFHQWVKERSLNWDWECVCDGGKPARIFDPLFDAFE